MVDHLFNGPQTLLRQIHVTPKPEAGQLLKGSASWKMTAWARRSTIVRSNARHRTRFKAKQVL